MTSPLELHSWIHGEPKASAGATSRLVHSPFDGSVLAKSFDSGPLDFVQALPAAKKDLETFAETSFAEREKFLRQIAAQIYEREKELAWKIALFEGWSEKFSLEKIVRPVEKFFLQIADEISVASYPEGTIRPTGLISLIIPGPMAFRTIGERLAPGLAAGNAFLVKVPSSSPITAMLWGEILKATELPCGLVSLFLGSGEELGPLFASHPSLRGVSFAGRASTAASIARAGSEGFKKLQISSGSKNSLLILPEADFSKLDQMLEGAFVGQGRLAWNLSQIFVTESKAEEFYSGLKTFLQNLKPLRSPEGNSVWTPVALPKDREPFQRARDQAVRDNGKLISSGEDEGAFHVRPLVIQDLTHCSTLQLEEITAPVFIINVVKYPHEMAKWTNTGDFGMCASIWGPQEKALKLGAKLQVGQVWTNGWLQQPSAFAGFRKSFFGIPDFRWNGNFFSDVKVLTSNSPGV